MGNSILVKQRGEPGALGGFADLSLARLPLGEAFGVVSPMSDYC
ncbi:hypothetical protein [Nostoc sp.]